MALIYTHYLQAMINQAERLGLDIDAQLESMGLQKSVIIADPVIDSQYSDQLIKWLWQETNDEFLGFALKPVKRGIFYTSLKLALQAETLYGGLREVCMLHDLATVDYRTELKVDGDLGEFSIYLNTGDKDKDHFLTDFTLSTWHRMACWLIGCQIPLLKVHLPYALPPSFLVHKHVFPTDIVYDSDRASFSFHRKFLDYHIVRTLSELRNFIRHSPRDLMEIPGADRSFEGRIKSIIMEESDKVLSFPAFEKIAEKLCVSPQTLRRKLRGEGTSYQNIKHTLRRDHCIEKLVRTKLSIAEIAYLVGFSEPAALTHSFRKWTGMSPAEYRKRFI